MDFRSAYYSLFHVSITHCCGHSSAFTENQVRFGMSRYEDGMPVPPREVGRELLVEYRQATPPPSYADATGFIDTSFPVSSVRRGIPREPIDRPYRGQYSNLTPGYFHGSGYRSIPNDEEEMSFGSTETLLGMPTPSRRFHRWRKHIRDGLRRLRYRYRRSLSKLPWHRKDRMGGQASLIVRFIMVNYVSKG